MNLLAGVSSAYKQVLVSFPNINTLAVYFIHLHHCMIVA
jgi:hypothetical protein